MKSKKKKNKNRKKVMFCHFYAKFSFCLLSFKSYGGKNFLEEMIEAKLHCCRPARNWFVVYILLKQHFFRYRCNLF